MSVVREFTAELSEDEQEAIFGGNAARFYGLQLPGDSREVKQA
jgi:predicted TIM-barrel fold metal-dependent hydrolase